MFKNFFCHKFFCGQFLRSWESNDVNNTSNSAYTIRFLGISSIRHDLIIIKKINKIKKIVKNLAKKLENKKNSILFHLTPLPPIYIYVLWFEFFNKWRLAISQFWTKRTPGFWLVFDSGDRPKLGSCLPAPSQVPQTCYI